VAAHQAWYAAINALFGGIKKFRVNYSAIPWATFTDPEIARVGLNEEEAKEKWPSDGKWKPSIHMPRFASRITLEVTEVLVERVQDITPDDILAEGIRPSAGDHECPEPCDARDEFIVLWDSINGKRNGGKYSWETNPYCWIILFKRLTK